MYKRQFLDPVSDKIFVATLLITLVAFGQISGLWTILPILIIAREFTVSGIREYLGPKGIKVPVSSLAKWKTATQMLALGFLIISGLAPLAQTFGLGILFIATFLTLITGSQYLWIAVQHFQNECCENSETEKKEKPKAKTKKK